MGDVSGPFDAESFQESDSQVSPIPTANEVALNQRTDRLENMLSQLLDRLPVSSVVGGATTSR